MFAAFVLAISGLEAADYVFAIIGGFLILAAAVWIARYFGRGGGGATAIAAQAAANDALKLQFDLKCTEYDKAVLEIQALKTTLEEVRKLVTAEKTINDFRAETNNKLDALLEASGVNHHD